MTQDPHKNVDAGNAEMAKAWDGDEGAHWAAHADHYDAVIAPYYRHLQEAAAVTPGEEVLDIGSGNGQTTIDAARAADPGGRAVGADLSGPMIEVARSRAAAEGVANVTFLQADAQVYPFPPASFDLVMSRFGVMFFADPAAAFANIAAALRPGGRVAFLVWQGLGPNAWARRLRDALAGDRQLPSPPPGAPGPFSLGERERAASLLSSAGLGHVVVRPVAEPLIAAHDAESAFAFVSSLNMARALLADLDERGHQAALDRLRAVIDAHATPDGVSFESAAWLLTASR